MNDEIDQKIIEALEYLLQLAQAGELTGILFATIRDNPAHDQFGIAGAVDFHQARRAIGSLRMIESTLVDLTWDAEPGVSEMEH